MASDKRSRIVTLNWKLAGVAEGAGGQGTLRLAYGTAKALNLPLNQAQVVEIDVVRTGQAYQRELYAGGPKITVRPRAQTIKRLYGGRVQTAQGDNYIVLHSGDYQERIHFTGKQRYFVKWLSNYASYLDTAIELRSAVGSPLAVVREDDGSLKAAAPQTAHTTI